MATATITYNGQFNTIYLMNRATQEDLPDEWLAIIKEVEGNYKNPRNFKLQKGKTVTVDIDSWIVAAGKGADGVHGLIVHASNKVTGDVTI